MEKNLCEENNPNVPTNLEKSRPYEKTVKLMKKLKGSKIIKKQSTLFPEKEVTLIPEIDLKEEQRLAAQIKDLSF